ncbi:hypothetical protein C2S51_020506 [Perilla frutescens var. frutescens]|nr:hypothetical protein C2S51_020506 [Perilla frutescens var. frutescens]
MEFFTKTKAVRLKSHLNKYLVAEDDQISTRQSRRGGAARKARWLVELVDNNRGVVRLKSCNHRYLAASNAPFLFGMTGRKVLQTLPGNPEKDPSIEWQPIRDGFQVKLIAFDGTMLRANGGTPPWRNSVTHDRPHAAATYDWVVWDVEAVESPLISFPRTTAMELFLNAKIVRLKSCHDKYLTADEDEESVVQDRDGSSKAAKWTVEFVENSDDIIRLRSCYGKYLTASNQPFLLGMTGRKRLDSSVEWEPVRERGGAIKLKTRYGHFMRANGGVPPWRNSVTHDIPHRTATKEWILWEVHVVDIQVANSPAGKPAPPLVVEKKDSFAPVMESPAAGYSSKPGSFSFSRQQSNESRPPSPKVGSEGRVIYFHIADENGEIDDGFEELSIVFKGNGVDELRRRLEEELGIERISVCARSPLNGKLFPLHLQLPPNNATMHLVVVPPSS